jgi:hypothetical protein
MYVCVYVCVCVCVFFFCRGGGRNIRRADREASVFSRHVEIDMYVCSRNVRNNKVLGLLTGNSSTTTTVTTTTTLTPKHTHTLT